MNELSASDIKLISALQGDAGMSQAELAERAGLSRTSVWRRVRELEDAGYIESRATLLNPALLGFQFHVLLSVSMVKHSERTRQQFEAHVQALPEVMECFSVSGDRDYVLQVICSDMASYNDFLNCAILDHPSVHSANSSFTLKRIKYTTALPL